MSGDRIFNNPVESALRSVVLLVEAYPATLDLQRLVYLDYLLVHSADADWLGACSRNARRRDCLFSRFSVRFHRVKERMESLAASTILDLTSVLEMGDLYDIARNEFLAVDIVLPVIDADDDPGQYCLHTGSHRYETNMPYEEHWKPVDGWRNTPHHGRGVEVYYAESAGTPWNQLAMSCVLRDRFFVKSWRRLLGKPA